jgi:hypothetical protein
MLHIVKSKYQEDMIKKCIRSNKEIPQEAGKIAELEEEYQVQEKDFY